MPASAIWFAMAPIHSRAVTLPSRVWRMASPSMDGQVAFLDAIACMAVSSPLRHASYISLAKSLRALFDLEGAGRGIGSLSSAIPKNSVSNCLYVDIVVD